MRPQRPANPTNWPKIKTPNTLKAQEANTLSMGLNGWLDVVHLALLLIGGSLLFLCCDYFCCERKEQENYENLAPKELQMQLSK